MLLLIKTYSIKDKLIIFKTIFNSNKFDFIPTDQGFTLIKYGTLQEVAIAILESSNVPLNVENIVDIIRKYYKVDGKYDSANSVLGNLKLNKKIYELDWHVLGLKCHFSYSQEHWGKISKIAKENIKKLQRQVNVVELLESIRKYYPKLRSKYELVYILREDNEIIDLGFFNFSLKSMRQKTRITVKDAIENIYKKNPKPRHFTEIRKEILEKRFLRVEGMNTNLKNLIFLRDYLGGFFGLKKTHQKNLRYLANNELYLSKIISYEIFPNTSFNRVLKLLQNENFEETIRQTIKNSSKLFLYEDLEAEPFIISKDWSEARLVRCILFNLRRTIYYEELRWILNDIGISIDESNRHKIKNDKYINFHGNKLSYVEFILSKDDVREISDICYDILTSSTSPESIEEICELINDEYLEISNNELIYILERDERFIILDEQIIMVK